MSNLTSISVLSLSVIALMLSSSALLVASECRESEKAALLKIKSSFGYSDSMATWNNSTDCCFFWHGVDCDLINGVVIYLWITDSNTSGPLPPSIGELPDLQLLNIWNHPNLTGPIPTSITKLRKLERLSITGTSISGRIPRFLCNMSSLYSLDLSENNLSGPIPDCFAGNVHIIDLSHNQLSGRIPASLFKGYTGNDTELNLSGNQLSGEIPLSFGTLNFLGLDLSYNRFCGDASPVFGASKFSANIHLNNNKFDFDLSPLTYPLYLSSLDISHNRIRGSINEQITELQGLGVLHMSYNRLCGPIPSGPRMRHYVPSTFLHNKCLCGTPLPPCVA